MFYYPEIVSKARGLRQQGFTYAEIGRAFGRRIPKSTLSGWLRSVEVSSEGLKILEEKRSFPIYKRQEQAVLANRLRRRKYLNGISEKNLPISDYIDNVNTAKIALSMLCLGEASKYKAGGSSFVFSNTNPVIIQTFLLLLTKCYSVDTKRIKCRIMCRMDQDIEELLEFWSTLVCIPRNQFYKTYKDERTDGKPTMKRNYKGVLAIEYHCTHAQLDLEDLARLVYNKLLE